MLCFGSDARLGALSRFAGRHLAIASSVVIKFGFLLPLGMKSRQSFWRGASEELIALRGDDPRMLLAQAEKWFWQDHADAEFISLAVDCISVMDGQRTTAVILTARPKDSTQRIMVFLPYTPRTASSPTVWREPRIDFPEESAGHLMPKQNLVLSELLKGRDSGA
jgi:hypothetical protein